MSRSELLDYVSAISKLKILKRAKSSRRDTIGVAAGKAHVSAGAEVSKSAEVSVVPPPVTLSGFNPAGLYNSLDIPFLRGFSYGSGISSTLRWSDQPREPLPLNVEKIQEQLEAKSPQITIGPKKTSEYTDQEIYFWIREFESAAKSYKNLPREKSQHKKLKVRAFWRIRKKQEAEMKERGEIFGEVPHFSQLSKFIKRSNAGLGYRANRGRGLPPEVVGRVLFMAGRHRDGEIAHFSKVTRWATDYIEGEIRYYYDNLLLKPDRRFRAYDPDRDRTNCPDISRQVYCRVKQLLCEIEKGAIKLNKAQKIGHREVFLKSGCGWQLTGLVWSMDEYDETSLKIIFPNLEVPKGARVIIVCSESSDRLFYGVSVITGQPNVSDYCRALWDAMNNSQKLTNLPPMRPAIVITDNCSAAVIDGDFGMLCAKMGIIHRNARTGTPHVKVGVESSNHVSQRRTSPIFAELDFNHFDNDINCSPEAFLTALIKAARSFNNGYPRKGKHSRNFVAERKFDFYCLSLAEDTLPPPITIYSDWLYIVGDKGKTPDECTYKIHRELPNAKYPVERDVADNSVKILVPGVQKPVPTTLIAEGVYLR